MGPRRPSWASPDSRSSLSVKPLPRRKRVRWSQCGRAVADAEVGGRRLVEPALREERPADLRLGLGVELLGVVHRGGLVGLHQPDALTALMAGVVPALLVAQGDAGGAREPLDGLREGQVVDLHHERDGVAALLAAEAVEEALAGADLERRRLLVVEGAQALQVSTARAAQLEVLGHHGVDRDRVPDRLHVLVIDPACHAAILRRRTDTPAPRVLRGPSGRAPGRPGHAPPERDGPGAPGCARGPRGLRGPVTPGAPRGRRARRGPPARVT